MINTQIQIDYHVIYWMLKYEILCLLLASNMMPPNTPCGSFLFPVAFSAAHHVSSVKFLAFFSALTLHQKPIHVVKSTHATDTGKHSHSDSCPWFLPPLKAAHPAPESHPWHSTSALLTPCCLPSTLSTMESTSSSALLIK
jgi:hypothetical protein